MASQIIGRAECPECNFGGAHVKQSEKCVYRYCPECGSQTIAKTDRQQENMRKHMRSVRKDDLTNPTSASDDDISVEVPVVPVGSPAVAVVRAVAPPVAKRRGLFG